MGRGHGARPIPAAPRSAPLTPPQILWGVARNRIRDTGASAQYGNANWLTLAALVSLVLGFCAGTLGACGRGRRRRGEKV